MAGLNSKGQAAVTDALFFLIVVMAISSFLLLFVTDYGQNLGGFISNRYKADFTTSALKTILYSNYPRDPDSMNLAGEPEVDYLMALVKEDYAVLTTEEAGDDKHYKIDEYDVALARQIREVMRPISDSHDYLFYINTKIDEREGEEIPFMFLKLTKLEVLEVPGKAPSIAREGTTVYYRCAPGRRADITNFTVSLGVSGRTVTSAAFPKIVEDGRGGYEVDVENSLIELASWLSTEVDMREDNPQTAVAEGRLFRALNCTKFTKLTESIQPIPEP